MQTFGEIINEAAVMSQHSGDADYKVKISSWVNFGHKLLADMYDYWEALQTKHRFSSVADQETYFFPSDFDKPYRLFDLTNNRKLKWTTREEWYESNISSIANANVGVPYVVMLYGVGAITSAIADAGVTLQAKSSSSADNSGIVVRIEGWLDVARTILGYEDITISTASPTTYATAATPTNFYGITRVTKSANTTGFITLATSVPTVLATIPPVDRESRYPTVYLGQIPADAYLYELLYKRKVKKLVANEDYPFMDCGDYLTLYAAGFAFHQEKESETRAKEMWNQAEKLAGVLMRNEMSKMGPDFQHKMIPKTARSHRQ